MILRCALVAVCFACTSWAADDIATAAHDPHLLAEYINTRPEVDLTPLRAYLAANDYGVLGSPCEPRKCHGEVIEVPDLKPVQAVLWIADSFNQYAIWLRYRKDTEGPWRLLSARLVNGHDFDPEYKLIGAFGKPFLVVVGLGIGGTGVQTAVESWFDLSMTRAQPVFSHTAQGFTSRGCEPCVVHSVRATAAAMHEENMERIRVEITTNFYTEPPDNSTKLPDLGSRTASAVYVRANSGIFTLDPLLSTATERALSILFDIRDADGMTNEQFLEFDIANLRRIASSPSSAEAKWLAEFLKTCKPSPQKSELLRLLH